MTINIRLSSLSISQQSVYQLKNSQSILNDLTQQLHTGKKSSDLTDYSAADVKRLFDLRGVVIKRESYLGAINTVEPRLKVYEQTLASIANVTDQGLRLIQNNPISPGNDLQTITSLTTSFLREVQYSLNQKVEDRYIYSGTRYNTEPVLPLLGLATPPVEAAPYTVANPTLPVYDTQAPGSSAASYATDTVLIEDALPLDYGISSNETAIQQVVQGLRWMYAATQDLTNYQLYMDRAKVLLTNAQDGVRLLRADNAAYTNTLTDTKEAHNRLINDVTLQADDITRADINEVSAQITFFQTQIQASYSATARLAKLTITDYL